jgi:hypothetical protein
MCLFIFSLFPTLNTLTREKYCTAMMKFEKEQKLLTKKICSYGNICHGIGGEVVRQSEIPFSAFVLFLLLKTKLGL